MNKEEEMIIDRFVRTNVREFNRTHYPIKPSDAFTHKVMMCCIDEEKKRTKINAILIGLLALTPFITREFWMLIKNDYISVSELPFSALIYNAYHVFMSPATFFVLLIAGTGLAAITYTKSWKQLKQTTITVKTS